MWADPNLPKAISSLAVGALGPHPDMQIKGAMMQQQTLLNKEQTDVVARKNAAARIIDQAFANGVAVEMPDGSVKIDPKQANALIHAVMLADPTANITPLLEAINRGFDKNQQHKFKLEEQNNEVVKVSPGETVGTRKSLGLGQDNGDGIDFSKAPEDGPQPLASAATGNYTSPARDTSKPIPANVNTGIINNIDSIRQIDKAISELGSHPNAVGLQNKIPVIGNPLVMNNLIDTEGVTARGAIANISSLKMHDRYGSRQTVTEISNLAPYLPQQGDSADVAIKKLNNLREAYVSTLADTASTYTTDNGYKPNDMLDKFLNTNFGSDTSAASMVSPKSPEKSLSSANGVYTSPQNGVKPSPTPVMPATQHGNIVEPALPADEGRDIPRAIPVASPSPSMSPLTSAAVAPTPIKLDAANPDHLKQAQQILQQAGGDPAKAREIATQMGFTY